MSKYKSQLDKERSDHDQKRASTAEENDDYVTSAVEECVRLWKAVKVAAKSKEFHEWTDSEKITHFREKLGFKIFMDDQPSVANYMICTGIFSMKAFKRYLQKCKMTKFSDQERFQKGFAEDQWCRRQADYFRYLWESQQRGHYDTRIAQAKWQEAYDSVRGDFDEFRNKHDQVKNTIAEEKKNHRVELTRELLRRIETTHQKLDEEGKKKLIAILKKAKKKTEEPDVEPPEYRPENGIQIIKHSDPVVIGQTPE